jgi:hypothetical protein
MLGVESRDLVVGLGMNRSGCCVQILQNSSLGIPRRSGLRLVCEAAAGSFLPQMLAELNIASDTQITARSISCEGK